MKIRVLSRDDQEYVRETKNDLAKVHRNFDEKLHPFKNQIEYSRALNAAKLDRLFAKPFVFSLDGHKDGVVCLQRHPEQVSIMASGSNDGEVRVWDLKNKKCLSSHQAHNSRLNGVGFNFSGQILATCGIDSTINLFEVSKEFKDIKFSSSKIVSGVLQSVNFSKSDNIFITGGQSISIWDVNHQFPTRVFELQSEVASCVKYNPIESNLVGACSTDKGFSLYDVRQPVNSAKITFAMRLNSISWNPIEANMVVSACEDSNCYMFDIRKLVKPFRTYYDHSSAVLDVDFSPTSREFLSASYDRSIRIFPVDKNKSREVYHTQRMQRVFCGIYTADSEFIACGSEEMNIRLWKTESSKPMGYLRPRQKEAINYSKKLIQQYQHHPEVKKINKHRHLPKHLYNSVEKKRVYYESQKRREENIRVFRKEKVVRDKVVIDIEK